jgi:peptidoglycan/xylan/chitin deacetylase (PgdA/CDA1 family)
MRMANGIEIKAMVSSIADYSGFLNTYAFLRRKLTKSQVAVLMYHRVCPRNDNWSLDPLSPQGFEKQMEYFCRNFEVISLAELSRYLQQRKYLPEKAVVITFDDGYKDNYLYAYPIIKKYHIPATIFLTTGHIGTGRLFWFDKVGYIIQHTSVNNLDLGKFGNHARKSNIDNLHTKVTIIERLKRMPEEEKNFLIERLLSISRITNIPTDVGKELILTWDEVKEMSNDGVDFGAHSVSHPILTNIPLEQAKMEILQSKKDIEEELSKEVIAFSYPNGDFNSEISKFIQESGFTCAVSVLPSALISPKDSTYEMSRMGAIEHFNKFKVVFCGLWGDLQSMKRRFG